jgi:hypothetical protein
VEVARAVGVQRFSGGAVGGEETGVEDVGEDKGDEEKTEVRLDQVDFVVLAALLSIGEDDGLASGSGGGREDSGAPRLWIRRWTV